MKKIFSLLVSNIILSFYINAQVPEAFKYQAVIRNNTLEIIPNQNVALKVSLLQTSETGPVIYSETHNIQTNAMGVVDLEIGNGFVLSGVFADVLWGATPYYLKIELDVLGGTDYAEMGTSQLLSVPYALFAQTVPNNSISGHKIAMGSDASGDIIYYNGSNYVRLPIGTTGQVLKVQGGTLQWKSDSIGNQVWQISSNDIYSTNIGNVGIGTATPNSKLEVKGTSTLPNDTLFQVKDSAGNPVFVVFPTGARVFVPDGTKATVGGFAVSGRSTNRTNNDYLLITPDSARIYVLDNGSKATVGGFAVSGRSTNRAITNQYLRVTSDSTRIYTADTLKGFGVQNLKNNQKTSYMKLTPYNYFIGHESGAKTIVSTSNGIYNVFIGYQSGKLNTTGKRNTFLGYNAGSKNNSGYSNVMFGTESGKNNTDGNFNTFIGEIAGNNNTTGSDNVFIGRAAGYSNTWNSSNIAIGPYSGYNLAGNSNIFVGQWCGYYNLGNKNTIIGYQAAYFSMFGAENVTIGYNAGNRVEGKYNVILGNLAQNTSVSNNDSNNVIVGYNVASTGSNQVRLGNANTTSLYCVGAYATTTAMNANLYVDNTGQIRRSTNSILDGTGAANRIPYYTDNNTLGNVASFVWDNTNSRMGINTAAPQTAIDINGAIATRNLNLALTVGDNNDINIGNYSFIYITGPTGAFSISSIANPSNGRIIILYNSTSYNMSIMNNAATGSPVNRINTLTGGSISTVGQGMVTLIYDSNSSKWIVNSIHQ